MTLLTLTAATPIAWTQIGPLATSEHWTVREGVILLTTETVLSDQQGEFFGIGSRVDLATGTTVFVRATKDTATINREAALVDVATPPPAQGFIGVAQATLNVDLLTGDPSGWFDALAFVALSVTIKGSVGISAGAIIFEGTNDPTQVPAGQTLNTLHEVGSVNASNISPQTIAASSNRTWIVPLTTRYVRARISTAFVGGTVQAIGKLLRQGLPLIPSTTQTVAGAAAHAAALSGNPVRLGARALSASYATLASGQVADLVATLQGALITRPWSIPELDWSFAAASGGIINTADVVVAPAAGAGLKQYLTSLQIKNTNGVATEVVVKDGSTVIWRGHCSANMTLGDEIVFANPLRTTANTALNVACITTGAAVYVNAQGYTAA